MRRVLPYLIYGMIATLPIETHAENQRAGNYIGCVTEEALDEYNTALSNDDQRLWKSLLSSGKCILVEGKEYSILNRGFITSKIKIYIGDVSIDVWVPSEALK